MFEDSNNDNANASEAAIAAEPAPAAPQAAATSTEPAPADGATTPVETASGTGANAPHHTETPPAAQGTPAVIKAQQEFLAMLDARIRNFEMLGLVALNMPETRLATANAYGSLWATQSRKSIRILARIKKRMRLMANP